jgi:hypothetical protein
MPFRYGLNVIEEIGGTAGKGKEDAHIVPLRRRNEAFHPLANGIIEFPERKETHRSSSYSTVTV